MEIEFLPVIIPALIAAAGYASVIAWFYRGWNKSRSCAAPALPAGIPVTVIIPARNEAHCILNCLEGMLHQDYDGALMEVIVADDHSDDTTARLVNSFAEQHPELSLTLLAVTTGSGKKAAIQQAMKRAAGALILTTDADCRHPASWITTMAGCFKQENPVFLSGPVVLSSDGGVLGMFQETEFMSLAASGAGSIGAGTPVMCNGANLGFSALAYRQLQADAMKNQTASGDDVFLMLAMKEKFGPGRILFVKTAGAVCEAQAAPTLRDYLNQRLRWVSKSRIYRDPFLIGTAIIVLAMNLGIFALAMAGFWETGLFFISLFLLIVKTLADIPLLVSYIRFTGKKIQRLHICWIIPAVVIFTTVVAIAGNLVNVTWKGRKVR